MATKKHLTESDRCTIASMLENRSSFEEIGLAVGKSATTISREVRNRSVWKKTGCLGSGYNACSRRFSCKRRKPRTCKELFRWNYCRFCSRCNECCPEFEKQSCLKLLKPPYVCNGCPVRFRCTLEKHIYFPDNAESDYRSTLSESRSGFALNEQELAGINDIVSPLLKKGQSIHHVCVNNADSVMISERSVYRLVDSSSLDARNLDLPRKVRFRNRKKVRCVKVDKKCREGRVYSDYLGFMEQNPFLPVVELDTVEGVRGGKVLLTVHFVKAEFMMAFLRDRNDAASVIRIFDRIHTVLGDELFRKLFPVCLADNGSEFSDPSAIETGPDGERRTRVFYCDPQAPYQKGSAERNHEFIRCFIPKGTDIGLYSQEQINLMMDHINSYSRESLGDKSPYAVFSFLFGKEPLSLLGYHYISPQKVTLSGLIFSEVTP